MKTALKFALILLPAFFVACTETLPPEDSNLPASGAPQAWENTMPGMGGMMPQDR